MDANNEDASEDAAAEQVRAVRWKLLCSVHQTSRERRAALHHWHLDWTTKLQGLHPSWPLNEILEMLLLTEGSAAEVDEQLAIWKARNNGLLPATSGVRDYQQFLSILHARHQQRIKAGHRNESREDRARRIRREQSEAWKRTFKVGKP